MVLVKIKKKKLVFVIGGVLLLLVGFLLGRINNDNKPPVEPTSTPSLSSPTEVPTETFKVTRVIDGDTIEIEGGERVRYIGIDTPETVDPRKPVQCFGIEASKKNKELVEGKNVRLEKDITDKDKYGRLLRYVYVDPSKSTSAMSSVPNGSGQAIFINLELVKQGFAFSYTYPPDIKYQEEILAAETEAREANRGLWEVCPIASPTVKL